MAFCFFESLFPVCTQNRNFWPKKQRQRPTCCNSKVFFSSRDLAEKNLHELQSSEMQRNKAELRPSLLDSVQLATKSSLRKLREIKNSATTTSEWTSTLGKRGISLKADNRFYLRFRRDFSLEQGPATNLGSCASTSIPCSFQCIHDKSNLGMLPCACIVKTFMRP